MGERHNAYDILSDVRDRLNENSSALLQGTDTTGAWANNFLMRQVNEAHRFLYNICFVRGPEDFLTSASVTPSASVLTLPANFRKLKLLEYTDTSWKIIKGGLGDKHLAASAGEQFLYRVNGRASIRIDKDGEASPCTVWYYRQIRELLAFQAAASSGASAIIIPASSATVVGARKVDDYYNGMEVEDLTALFVSTITDYVASSRTLTVTGTASAADWCGLIPEIPEDFHHLVAFKAGLLAKNHPKSPEKPTVKEDKDFMELLAETLRSYYGTANTDESIDSIFLDFDSYY